MTQAKTEVAQEEADEDEPDQYPDELIDLEQDAFARKRGFRNIDEYLDSKVN